MSGGKPSILLCSLGTSPWLVAEACRYGRDGYDEVWIFTSSSERTTESLQQLEPFFETLKGVRIVVTRPEDFQDLRNQAEHDAFEEALGRWYLESLEVGGGQPPTVCIAGGFKSMSSALQKLAHLLGAKDVFHVTAEKNPNSLEAVEEAFAHGEIHFISLGSELGWASLRHLSSEDFPLEVVREEGLQRWVKTPGPSLRDSLREGLDRIAARASGWEKLGECPFASLAWLGPQVHAWLDEPLREEHDRGWLGALPKTELHCHLGGIATHGESLERVRAAARGKLPALEERDFPEGWPLPKERIALDSYMKLGDNNGSKLLTDPGCLEEQVRETYRILKRERVAYAEIRCSPANYATLERPARRVLEEIRGTFEACMEEARAQDVLAPQVNLIIIVTRRKDGDLSSISRHLALAVDAAEEQRPCRVVGVDLAGYENRDTRPEYFESDFRLAHRCGLAVTAHAGENDDVESIWQAVYRLFARRIGHGLRLRESRDLMRVAADRRIGIEMCPYANYQIHGFAPMPGCTVNYPLREYLAAGLAVSVNTDNPGISAAGLVDNFLLLPKLCPGITRREVLQLLRNGLDTAFIDPTSRRQLLNRIEPEVARVTHFHARAVHG